jgi:YggT family protein
VSRGDLADFVSALALVYIIMIFAYIVLSLLPIPYNPVIARIREFLDQTVSPYLNLFRRFIPPVGMFDLSPMLALIVLYIVRALVVGAIEG